MGLSLSTNAVGNHKVVAVAGDLDATAGEELRGELLMLLNDGACYLVVDIDRVEHADSAGLEALADPLKTASSFGGSLRLVCIQEPILKTVKDCTFGAEIPIHTSVQDAALATEHRQVPGRSLQDDPRQGRCRRTASASEFGSARVNTKPVFAAGLVRFAAGLTRRLPAALSRLRTRVFVGVNGSAGVSVPGDLVLAKEFRSVYAHPAASGRSRGSALADLTWFWIQPGGDLHQELIEPGPRYQQVARCTRTILTADRDAHAALAHRCTTEVLDELAGTSRRSVRLREVIMPIAAQLFYEIVFREHCPHDARDQIAAYAADILDALKCVRLRRMRHRYALTRYLQDRIEHGTVPHPLPTEMTTLEQALYLQMNFFATGVVQTAEAITHVLFELARYPHVQDRIAADLDDTDYLDRVVDETMRMYPVSGVVQRITTADIVLDPDRVLPAGSVLCFDFLAYQRSGFQDPDRYDPDRWTQLDRAHATYLPYGITGNRPCPARGIMPAIIRTVTVETLRRYDLRSTAQHTRALTNRAPCILTPRTSPSTTARTALLAIRLRDHWEMLWHSIVQLVLGAIMIAQARNRQLCRRYYQTRHMR